MERDVLPYRVRDDVPKWFCDSLLYQLISRYLDISVMIAEWNTRPLKSDVQLIHQLIERLIHLGVNLPVSLFRIVC
ncbi:hypothetical protein AQ749_19650 [Burkholderia pseudomallei]|nr:hypothetical protein AQ749_19650 [Burkholderia pseudomallei]ONA10177.1 hypothetical protein AQ877_05905 [Burkholderia pseudomallei]ONE94464.1 hypothetical protein AQ958_01630 [Burkholderia pseudomallei]ONF09210.1 hypothetical protein AQ960_21805 [Burkholderia pseudomallei]